MAQARKPVGRRAIGPASEGQRTNLGCLSGDLLDYGANASLVPAPTRAVEVTRWGGA